VTKTVGVIGAGRIVPFHIDALLEAGFELDSIASRAGSERAAELNARYSPTASVDSAQQVIDRNPDALVVASDVASLPQILAQALKGSSKILIEKPVSYSADVIRSLSGIRDEDVLVGYNRRFYSSALEAKRFVNSNGLVAFQATIAESSSSTLLSAEQKQNALLANSVHVLDLLHAIFGRIVNVSDIIGQDGVSEKTQASLTSKTLPKGIVARLVNVVTENGHVGNINLYFGAPANFAVDMYAQGHFAQMRPLENFVEYDSIAVCEPTPEVPIRTYRPRVVEPAFTIAQSDLDFKPGFLEQARALKQMAEGTKVSDLAAGASLADAVAVLELAERIAREL